MEQRLSLITLGVADLARARRFYEDGLGWRASGPSSDEIRFIQLPGFILALWDRKALAADSKLEAPEHAPKFREFTLAYNLRSRVEVDATMKKVSELGATILKPAGEAFWGGYTGHFADPDGHVWELAWNPHFPITPDGATRLPD